MAYMDYQAPQKTDFSVINNALDSIYQQRQDEKKNKLLDIQTQREQNALDKENKSNTYRQQYADAKDDNTKNDIMKQWATFDPQGMNQTLQAYDALDEQGQKDLRRKAETVYKHISGVMNEDGTLNTQAYNAKAPQYGLPQIDGRNVTVQSVMGELKQAQMQVMGIGEYAKMQEQEKMYSKREDRRENFELNKLNKQNANALALQDRSLAGQKEIHQMDNDARSAIWDKQIAAGKFANNTSTRGFDIAAFKAATDTLKNYSASEDDKLDAKLTIKALKDKYGQEYGSIFKENSTPTDDSWEQYLKPKK